MNMNDEILNSATPMDAFLGEQIDKKADKVEVEERLNEKVTIISSEGMTIGVTKTITIAPHSRYILACSNGFYYIASWGGDCSLYSLVASTSFNVTKSQLNINIECTKAGYYSLIKV